MCSPQAGQVCARRYCKCTTWSTTSSADLYVAAIRIRNTSTLSRTTPKCRKSSCSTCLASRFRSWRLSYCPFCSYTSASATWYIETRWVFIYHLVNLFFSWNYSLCNIMILIPEDSLVHIYLTLMSLLSCRSWMCTTQSTKWGASCGRSCTTP